ncbi:DNA ligase D [Thalassobaculum sp.]|uniref:DNA ligase D n=1 Tax=Thalassobaculum sp. TaxID=2022740 RepID=UPI0032F0750C
MARTPPTPDRLGPYRSKRKFDRTPEPSGGKPRRGRGHLYTIQKHDARRLHYDLRLELDGVLKSWAITRGPSLNPSDKRLAVRTEDHPVEYATFEGRIPEGNYGAGTVLLWDRGDWRPVGDPHEGLDKGKLVFELHGYRLRGRWALVRFKGKGKASGKRENWLLIKELDDEVDRERDVTADSTTSVASGRSLKQVARDPAGKPSKRKSAKRGSARPNFVEPALATLVDEAPAGAGWLYEVKFDGYRALSAVSGGDIAIYTRSGLDWTDRYPAIVTALAGLDLDGALLDGEIVATDDAGRTDFSALHRALERGGRADLSYFVFDLLAEGGEILRDRPLVERKERLQALLGDPGRHGPVYFTDHVDGDPAPMLEKLCDSGFEGIIAKRADARYRSGRGRSWLKVKCGRDQEFVVVGWSPSGKSRPFASLLLATRDGDDLLYAGRVGTGFSHAELDAIAKRLHRLARRTSPVRGEVPSSVRRDARWVTPELVAQVEFAEFTADGLVRHGRFKGLREDKPARSVRRERPAKAREAGMNSRSAKDDDQEASIGGVRLSHPDRVLFPGQGITKRELARYLQSVAGRMLPYVADRLVSLVRCPQGRARQCFFQRHDGAGLPGRFKRLPVKGKDGSEENYVYLTEPKALVEAAQMGVLELHVWGSRIDDLERPDRIVFDLDPDESVKFAAVKEAAGTMREALDALGLRSFPLLTGGKGIHVVVPITRRHGWTIAKAFARALAQRFAEDDPDRYVATMSKARRRGRIFIDYFRNDRTATAIAPYSPRAREGAPVAWPVAWDDIAGIEAANAFSVRNADPEAPDPWDGYREVRQSLKAASLRALGVEPE